MFRMQIERWFVAGALLATLGTANAQNQTPAHLSYAGDVTGIAKKQVTLSVVVKDNNGRFEKGGKVTFKLGSQTCSAAPGENGVASCSVTLNENPGQYKVDVQFRGSSLYAGAASIQADFTVQAK